MAGAAYGFADMGPWAGAQAELLRVPWGDFNCLRLPEGDETRSDYVMLADIWPTGCHATELAGSAPATDRHLRLRPRRADGRPLGDHPRRQQGDGGRPPPDRLRLAESIGAIPIDDSNGRPGRAVLEQTMGLGADSGCECVGYQAHDPEGTSTRTTP